MKDLKSKLSHYRLSDSEYRTICDSLGRPPQGVEWALFSALWSEHCSYKSSRVHLKKFAKTLNSKVVTASGENAGVVDLGLDERIVFKMESHNHPSFIEPYQGAATGVGGILRDIFTMGARPIASADFLCFGLPEAPRMKSLVDGVVRGIAGYGNCVGVPTVTGFTEFHESYNNNILVNAMSVGLLRPGETVALSKAKGPGNKVIYVGAKTGKDGVHGAAMASESFDENSDSKKPNVQIGDPYFEKLLIESCLEVLQKNLVVAIQDMGAAGLTSSSFEMASKGKVGMELDLSLVPLRDSSMTPEEILLSESQERMLLVAEPQRVHEIQKIFARWGLDAVEVGVITENPCMRLLWRGEVLTDIHPDLLVENAPQYEREFEKWSSKSKLDEAPRISPPSNLSENILRELGSPMGSSRRDLYRQYDQRVGGMTARGAESSVAFLRLPDSGRGLGIALGCRPSVMRVDARLGALDSVLYPALQMALKGARVWAITDCLNFGNPEKPGVMSEFVASVEAITEVALALESPVVSGNVSFYNETLGKNITSTPAIGLVGLRPNVDRIPRDSFSDEGNIVYLLKHQQVCLYKDHFVGDLEVSSLKTWIREIESFCQKGFVHSSRVVGRGGLAMALAKHSMEGYGLRVEIPLSSEDLLVENLYSVLIEVNPHQVPIWGETLGKSVVRLGKVQKDKLELGPIWGSLTCEKIRAASESGVLSMMRS